MAHRGLTPNHRRRRLLRACRERPCRRAAECGQQFPPSDGGCHTPLPCEVRKGNDTTPRACSLAVQGGQNAGCCRPASGSKAERLSFPLCPRKRTYLPILQLLPPPALRERCHGGLARRGIAITLPEGYCPHPRRTYRRRMKLHDTADDDALDIRPSHIKGTHHVTALGTIPPAIACEIVAMDSRVGAALD